MARQVERSHRTLRNWAEPLLLTSALVLVQIVATRVAWGRLTYEELAESVRNPFWLSQHDLYDGTSGNIAWYALCLVHYRIFGFSLALAKAIRIGLFAVSLVCAVDLLRRFLPGRTYLPMALAIGLSPTLLYYNTYQARRTRCVNG